MNVTSCQAADREFLAAHGGRNQTKTSAMCIVHCHPRPSGKDDLEEEKLFREFVDSKVRGYHELLTTNVIILSFADNCLYVKLLKTTNRILSEELGFIKVL